MLGKAQSLLFFFSFFLAKAQSWSKERAHSFARLGFGGWIKMRDDVAVLMPTRNALRAGCEAKMKPIFIEPRFTQIHPRLASFSMASASFDPNHWIPFPRKNRFHHLGHVIAQHNIMAPTTIPLSTFRSCTSTSTSDRELEGVGIFDMSSLRSHLPQK